MTDLGLRAVVEEDNAGADERGCTLTFGLDERHYRRLSSFVARYKNETGEKLSLETVLELALMDYLTANERPLCES